MPILYKESYYNIDVCKDTQGRTLLFNSISESLAWFTPEVLATFQGKSEIQYSSLLPDIIRAGFVVVNTKDEVCEYMYARHQIAFDKNPKQLSYVIAPTMACNYNCEYCFESKKESSICQKRTMDNIVAFIKAQVELDTCIKHLHIQWFGGEPLLAFDSIEYISDQLIRYCNDTSTNFTSTVITNGYLLNREKINKLRMLKVNNMQITLDGLAETYAICKGCQKDCFDVVIANIKDCDNIIPIVIRLNVSKRNKNEIQDLIAFILDHVTHNVKFHIAPVHAYNEATKDITLGNEEFKNFQRDLINWACNVGYQKNVIILRPRCHPVVCDAMLGKSYVIGPDGCLYKCTHQIGYKEYSVGNVETGATHNAVALSYVENELPNKCGKCKILPVCAGGCITSRIHSHVDVDCVAKFSEVMETLRVYARVKKIT